MLLLTGLRPGLRENDPPLACAPHNASGVLRFASQAARFFEIGFEQSRVS